MSRAANVVDNDAWDASDDGFVETRPVRDTPTSSDPYRFERDRDRERDPRKSEWNSSLLLVQEACEAIQASEDRVQALESEIEALNQQHREAFLQMKARVTAAEEQIKAAHAEAKAFEDRALEAEAWLVRLNQAIMNGFGGNIKREKLQARG